jgi:FkbM family methyltransferase
LPRDGGICLSMIRTILRSFVRPAIGDARRRVTNLLSRREQVVAPVHSHQQTSISIAGIPHPIRLRLASSDAKSMASCLLDLQYDFDLGFEPKTILDLGGNIGCSAIYFANRWPKSSIYAVEPFRENYELLEINTAPYSNVRAARAAATCKPGPMSLVVPEAGFWGVQAIASSPLTNPAAFVEGKTICGLMDDAGFERVDLLKMDIEGSEFGLFRENAAEWLRRTRVLVVELHDWIRPGCSWYFERAIRDRQSRRMVIDENVVVWLAEA